MSEEEDDLLNPFGGPSEAKIDKSFVALILETVRAGVDLMQVADGENHQDDINDLWNLQRSAIRMLHRDMGRRRRKRQKLESKRKKQDQPDQDDEDEWADFDP